MTTPAPKHIRLVVMAASISLLLSAIVAAILVFCEARRTCRHEAAVSALASYGDKLYTEVRPIAVSEWPYLLVLDDRSLRHRPITAFISRKNQSEAIAALPYLRSLRNLDIERGCIGIREASSIVRIRGLRLVSVRATHLDPAALELIASEQPECEVIQDGIHIAGPNKVATEMIERRHLFPAISLQQSRFLLPNDELTQQRHGK